MKKVAFITFSMGAQHMLMGAQHIAVGCAAYADGCAAYAVGCAAYAESCAAYVQQCKIKAISAFQLHQLTKISHKLFSIQIVSLTI